VVDGVSLADAAEPADARQNADRKTPVHEAVVDHHVGDAERGHPGSEADRGRGEVAMQIASNHHQRRGHRRVRGGEGVVQLEAALAPSVVRAVDPPQGPVPDPAVEEAGPRLHGRRHHQRDRGSQQDRRERAHGAAS
jgi:hypothetical protein